QADGASRILGKVPSQERQPIVEDAHSGTNNRPPALGGRKDQAQARGKGGLFAEALAGEANSVVHGQLIVEGPMVLVEEGKLIVTVRERRRPGKIDSVGE